MNVRSRYLLAICAAACMSIPHAFAAKSGVCMDNVIVKADDKVIFADNFDDGDMKDWHPGPGTSLLQTSANPPNYSVFMDRGARNQTQMFHTQYVPKLRALEVSAYIWLPPVKEQYGWSQKSRHESADFRVLPLNTDSGYDLVFGAMLEPGDVGYRINITLCNNNKVEQRAVTKTAVLTSGKWSLLTLRLDPDTENISVSLDGKEQVSCSYVPNHFKSFREIVFESTLGTEPPAGEK